MHHYKELSIAICCLHCRDMDSCTMTNSAYNDNVEHGIPRHITFFTIISLNVIKNVLFISNCFIIQIIIIVKILLDLTLLN